MVINDVFDCSGLETERCLKCKVGLDPGYQLDIVNHHLAPCLHIYDILYADADQSSEAECPLYVDILKLQKAMCELSFRSQYGVGIDLVLLNNKKKSSCSWSFGGLFY